MPKTWLRASITSKDVVETTRGTLTKAWNRQTWPNTSRNWETIVKEKVIQQLWRPQFKKRCRDFKSNPDSREVHMAPTSSLPWPTQKKITPKAQHMKKTEVCNI